MKIILTYLAVLGVILAAVAGVTRAADMVGLGGPPAGSLPPSYTYTPGPASSWNQPPMDAPTVPATRYMPLPAQRPCYGCYGVPGVPAGLPYIPNAPGL